MSELTWLGRSCFELRTRRGQRILFDPYLERYRARYGAGYPPPDMICVSHGHLDHFADVPDLIRGDSPALVVATPRLCRALRTLVPETEHRLFPLPWDDECEVEGIPFFAFRSPPMETSLYDMFEEFGAEQVEAFLQAFRQLADDILYLPLTSFGLEADGVRLLHFVTESENGGEEVDVAGIGERFRPDVALISVNPGEEERAAAHAADLGARWVIPHHYHAYGKLPAADLARFAHTLEQWAPGCRLQVLEEMQTISL
ncbi:MAG: MBL fold metallo-hydrolase [Anaerolineae bacterium]|nr:MBL fold metallo-hydrolase [Anaerolineae bacterium]